MMKPGNGKQETGNGEGIALPPFFGSGLIIVLCMLTWGAPVADADESASASAKGWGLWGDESAVANPYSSCGSLRGEKGTAKPTSLLGLAFRVYREYLSPVDHAKCPCNPTCSTYSKQAIKKKGFCIGIMLTVDRFVREPNMKEYGPTRTYNGVTRYYDPVESNTFWWEAAGRDRLQEKATEEIDP